MPKVHNIGPRAFVQLAKLPLEWGSKLAVRGWTQEIEEPYRISNSLLIRLPRHRVLVLGMWSGQQEEEKALSKALQTREVTYDDFSEEAGWTPPSDEDREEGGEPFYTRPSVVGRDLPLFARQEPQ